MKALVTGGAGFIGSNLVKRLVKEGCEVVSLDNYSTGTKDNHIEGVTYVEGDIETIEYIKGDYEICFHLAAQSRVQPSFDDPTETLRANVVGTSAVMEWSKVNDCQVIYAGSSSKHKDPTDSPYAMYKFLGEEILRLYRNSFDGHNQICRFYNAYGPNESLDIKNGNVIGIWRKLIEEGKPITIVGDGHQRRDFIHVDDIVDALIKVWNQDVVHNDGWELGVGKSYSINELFQFFQERYPKIKSVNIPDQKGNYRETRSTCHDARKILGWEPKDRLEDYIKSL